MSFIYFIENSINYILVLIGFTIIFIILIFISIFFHIYWILNYKKINEQKTSAIGFLDEIIKSYGFTKKWVEVEGMKILAVERKSNSCQGIPLIFVHGTFSSSQTFYHLISLLPDKYHCITVDLPNFGISDSMNVDDNLDKICIKYADFLDKFIQKLGYRKVNLIGHSLGAIFSLYLARKRKNLINKLFLLSTPGLFRSFGRYGYYTGIFFKLLLPPNLSKLFFIKKLEKSFQYYFRNSEIILRYYIALTFLNCSGNDIIGKFIKYNRFFLYGCWKKPLLYKILSLKCNTLLFIGKNDLCVQQHEDFFKKYKHICFKKFDSSHNVHSNYDDFKKALIDEIEKSNKKISYIKPSKIGKLYRITKERGYSVPSLNKTEMNIKNHLKKIELSI